MGCKKYLVTILFSFLLAGTVLAQEEAGDASKPPAEVPLEANESLDNLKYSNNLVAGFEVTGAGIITSAPDNAFIQLTMKSSPGPNLKAADIDVNQKVDFLIRGLCRQFKLKKENFAVSAGGTQMQERSKKGASADDVRDADGNVIPKKSYSNTAKKLIVVNDLGKKKPSEIMDIIDAASKYGATAIVSIVEEDSMTESVTSFAKSSTKTQAVKGGSGLKITSDIQNPDNQMITYHFKEDTLKALLKQAKDGAYKEIKEKMAKAREKVKINDKDFDIDMKEDSNLTGTEDGLVIIRTDVKITYVRPQPKE